MASTIRHRGPDDQTLTFRPNAGIAFTRLAIVDLEDGGQPFVSTDERVVAVCNGEIYNHADLRNKLEQQGYRFRSRSDCEVLLPLYEQEGANCVDILEGQFALLVYDGRRGRVLAARDAFGVVPLFYTVVDGLLIIGSEIKALLAHPLVPREIDPIGLDQVVSLPGPVSPRTLFRGIRSLRPGHLLDVNLDNGDLREVLYWDLNYPTRDNHLSSFESADEMARGTDALLEQLACAFRQSVAARLQGEAPIGVYLSGGLDSSLVAAEAVALAPSRSWRSVSVTFDDPELDESRYQKLAADALKLNHRAYAFREEELGERLRRVVRHAECPVKELLDTAALALSEFAQREGLKVVLAGQGADELFAGYVGHRFDKIRALRQEQYSDEERRIRRALWGDETFLYEKDQAGLRRVRETLYSSGLRAVLSKGDELPGPVIDPSRIRGRHPVHRRCYVDLKLRLADHLLADLGDRMAYASSIEVRYPFLDRAVAEISAALPPSFLLSEFEEKHALKRLAHGRIPPAIIKREKFGLTAPGTPVLMRLSLGWVEDLLRPDRIAREGFFEPSAVAALRHRYTTSGFQLQTPFEDDLLAIVLTFGLLLEEFDVPGLPL